MPVRLLDILAKSAQNRTLQNGDLAVHVGEPRQTFLALTVLVADLPAFLDHSEQHGRGQAKHRDSHHAFYTRQ